MPSVLQSVPNAPEAVANEEGVGVDGEEEPLKEQLQKLDNAAPVVAMWACLESVMLD